MGAIGCSSRDLILQAASDDDRGCVKTRSEANFQGRRTITRVPIVDPGASNELDDFLGPSISEFSHGLDPKQTLSAVRVTDGRKPIRFIR